LPRQELPPQKALGLFLGDSVRAQLAFPPHAVAAMDGYAVRHKQAQGAALPVAFLVQAGDMPRPLPEGTCARIFTGAVIPAGADAVVPQEEVRRQEKLVLFPQVIAPGANIRQRGEIFGQGEVILTPGTPLSPAAVALLAAAGVKKVLVVAKPRVFVLATGSELTAGTPRPGQIVDSNTPLLRALLAKEPAQWMGGKRVADRLQPLRQALEQACQRADVLITTGGVSVGDFDLLPRILEELGGQLLFHKVSMQPGKPILAAQIQGRWLLGLPGNPVSALVGFRLFARPLLRALAGEPQAFAEPWLSFPLAKGVANPGGRTQFLPSHLLGRAQGPTLEVLPWKGSHDLRAAAQATHLACLPPGFQGKEGEPLEALPLY